jgi:hypothetical protein
MSILTALLGVIVAAVISYVIDEILKKIINAPNRRFIIDGIVFVIALAVFALVAFPKARDYARLIVASPDDRRCYFSEIVKPEGATTQKDAVAFDTPKSTPIEWEPNNCVMVIQSYQDTVLAEESKMQRSGKALVEQFTSEGVTEIKIFRDGFQTESSSIWINVTP